jgi:hypothetical protein
VAPINSAADARGKPEAKANAGANTSASHHIRPAKHDGIARSRPTPRPRSAKATPISSRQRLGTLEDRGECDWRFIEALGIVGLYPHPKRDVPGRSSLVNQRGKLSSGPLSSASECLGIGSQSKNAPTPNW